MHRLASLAAVVLLCSCGTLPRGLTPKPDIRPVSTSQARAQESVGKARESIGKTRVSQAEAAGSVSRAVEALEKFTGTSEAATQARASLALAQGQLEKAKEYSQWADTELANSWRYLEEAKSQIGVLSTQIDTSHANEQVAVAAVEKWKPIIEQVNSYWGLGAFAYGLKVLFRHLFIAILVLAVIGGALFIFARPVVTLIATWFTVVLSWFRRK